MVVVVVAAAVVAEDGSGADGWSTRCVRGCFAVNGNGDNDDDDDRFH